jgi:hypothetical protein
MPWKNWRGPELIGGIITASRQAVSDTCYVVLEAAKQEVPHDEGTLERSGMVIMAPEPEPAGVICFGGGPGTGHPIVPYAVRWHENSANFQKGRKRFYLKDPYNRLVVPTLKNALVMRIGQVLQ